MASIKRRRSFQDVLDAEKAAAVSPGVTPASPVAPSLSPGPDPTFMPEGESLPEKKRWWTGK